MWLPKMTNISEDRMDVEFKLPKTIWQSKIDYKRRHMHEILWWDDAVLENSYILCTKNWPITNKRGYKLS